MRLSKAKVTKYRSIRNTALFDIEQDKTILVGVNEAGKSALLQALQQLNPPAGTKQFDILRDYPRSEYNDVDKNKVSPDNHTVVEGHFSLDGEDRKLLPKEYHQCTYVRGIYYNNKAWHRLDNSPDKIQFSGLKKDITRFISHVLESKNSDAAVKKICDELTANLDKQTCIQVTADIAQEIKKSIEQLYPHSDEENKKEQDRYDKIILACDTEITRATVLSSLRSRLPIFVLFNNYFRVRPNIHLDSLAKRIETKVLDDDAYDYGNVCLLKLLGFDARELSDLGKAELSDSKNEKAMEEYRAKLDKRFHKLNAASTRLTKEIREIWNPDTSRGEADSIRMSADGQYLRVTVTDDIGVDIELDQRSEGFQWLVSFFIVFFAEAEDQYQNAILLLDEPGLSLHGLKQREFRQTLSKLAVKNQLLYSTHSPFLVGPDELDIVRVVEMLNRADGTKVHSNISSSSSASLLPLQESLGYDLAQSLFSQQRNLVLEGLTDFWYIDAVANILKDEKTATLNEKIALIPANSAGKVVYFATILHSHNLKVAALLDSDSAGEQAAKQEILVHKLGQKNILRTKDFYNGDVSTPEIEDMLRVTLVNMAKVELNWDIEAIALSQTSRPIIDIFNAEIQNFSKYKLAKTFLRWSALQQRQVLTEEEVESWKALINKINGILK